MTETAHSTVGIDNEITGLAAPLNSRIIPYEEHSEADKARMDEADRLIDIMKAGRAFNEHDAVQIYEEKQRVHERMQALETQVAAIYKAGHYRDKQFWYFPAQVHVAVNNEHRGLDYTLDEVLTACANLGKRKILVGRIFPEHNMTKYVYNTY